MITTEQALQMAEGRRMFVSMVDHEKLTDLLNEVYKEALKKAANEALKCASVSFVTEFDRGANRGAVNAYSAIQALIKEGGDD